MEAFHSSQICLHFRLAAGGSGVSLPRQAGSQGSYGVSEEIDDVNPLLEVQAFPPTTLKVNALLDLDLVKADSLLFIHKVDSFKSGLAPAYMYLVPRTLFLSCPADVF